jgi:hypothetical protein
VNTRSFSLRDYLIVGIGDSFLSGAGNPNGPAVAAPDQQVMCKAMSTVLVATKFKEAVEELGRELEADEAKVIAEIPHPLVSTATTAKKVSESVKTTCLWLLTSSREHEMKECWDVETSN